VFASTLVVRMRPNSPCLRVLYSVGCGRIAHVSVYAIRADGNKYLLFECTLFLRFRTNSPCLRVQYSCGCGRIRVYAIRAYAYE